MTDTPQHVQDIHLQLWLAQSPGERLLQALKNNEGLYLMFKHGRQEMEKLRAKRMLDEVPVGH